MSAPLSSVSEAVASLRREHPSCAGAGWDFDGFSVWVDSNEPALIAELERYFVDFRRLPGAGPEPDLAALAAGAPLTRISALQADPPDLGAGVEMTIGEYKPSVRGPKEAFFDVADGRVVHKLRTGMWFLFGRDEHLAIGPCTANPNQVINFVNNRMIQRALHDGAILGHAAAVAIGGRPGDADPPRAIAIAGFSGMGKSTLSLNLMNDRRLDFLSNDRVMIHAGASDDPGAPPIVQGVPKHPRINPGTILHNAALGAILQPEERRRFMALEPGELWQLEHKYDALIGQCFPNQRFVLRAQLVGLVLLNWSREGGATQPRRIDVSERLELLPALMKAAGVFYLPRGEDLEAGLDLAQPDPQRYVERLRGVEVLELAGGVDFERGRNAALELLGL
nr:HprK-related kinase B [Pseudenhygromyxa sp. WMMC2535]